MNPELKISVIIPTFNRADLLRVTVSSVLAQTRPADEILIIDDGSEDHTQSVISEFGEKVKSVAKKNSGKADSLNQAIAATSGTHIWIVDDDDIIRPEALETLIGLQIANPHADLVYGRHIRFEQAQPGGEKVFKETGHWDRRPSEYFLIATLEDFFVHQPAMLVTRSLYERAGPFNTEMIASEDYDMLIRLAAKGRAAATDKIIFEQRVHAGIRGQKGYQFGADERDRKWIEYDQKIFRSVFGTLPLAAYLPKTLSQTQAEALTRQANIQRAAILGRKKLWPLAIAELKKLAETADQPPLSPDEYTILRRTLFSKYGCKDLLTEPDIMAALKQVRHLSPFGRALTGAIGRSLLWHVKRAVQIGQLKTAAGFLQHYFALR